MNSQVDAAPAEGAQAIVPAPVNLAMLQEAAINAGVVCRRLSLCLSLDMYRMCVCMYVCIYSIESVKTEQVVVTRSLTLEGNCMYVCMYFL